MKPLPKNRPKQTITTLNNTAPSFTLPRWDYEYSKEILSNGLTLIEVIQPHLHSTAISVFVKCGSRYETAEQNGLSHFLEHMVFRGTRQYPTAFELNVAFEKLGGTLNACTAPDSTEFSIALPQESTVRGMELIHQVVSSPQLGDIEIERKVIIEEIREDLDENDLPVDLDFWSRKRLWNNNPLGQSVIGPLKNVQRFNMADLQKWFDSHYVAPNIIACIAGSIESPTIRSEARNIFKTVRSGPTVPSVSTPKCTPISSAHHVHKPGSQTQLRVAFHVPGLTDKRFVETEMLARLLDDGMSTPIHRRIFEEKGLAYNVSADLEAYEDTGVLNVDAVSSHDNVVDIIKEIIDIVRDMRDSPIPPEDLSKAKARTRWNLSAFQDAPGPMNSWYGEQELFRPAITLEQEAAAVSLIQEEQIRDLAKRVFTPGNILITTVGVQSQSQQEAAKKLASAFS